jgi:hypothetical protein
MAAGGVPILRSAGEAVRFLRTHWRFVLAVAALGAGAHTVTLLVLAGNIVSLPLVAFVSAATYAALLGAALVGPQEARARWLRDAANVLGAMAIVSGFLMVVAAAALFGAMSVALGPYAEELRQAGEDQAAVGVIVERALGERAGVLTALGVFGAAIWLALTSRFYLAAPASVDQRRIAAFASWTLTKGEMLRISAARLCVLAPALILTGALQSAWGALLGAPTSDLSALLNFAQAQPAPFAAYFAGGLFVQVALYAALEAGLSAYLYTGLRVPQSPPAT